VVSVLVVDDDRDIRDLLVFKLRQVGFDVFAEADGEAGLAAAIEVRPDVVVVDWMMPKLTGLEVCQQLRAHDDVRSVGIILLTARAQEVDVSRGFAAGADDYVVKPFSPRELVDRIQALLARSR
jgi:two-component system phosphate regulon response regulator PhoB